jgi:hypothetical protein
MLCPKCDQKLEVSRKNVSQDFEKKKEYDRAVHVCRKDDVWVTVEAPKTDLT